MAAVFTLIVLVATGLIESSKGCNRPLDIVFLTDGSDSICGGADTCPNWLSILQFSKDVASRFKIGPDDTKVGYVTISDGFHTKWNLNAYKDITSLSSAIDNIKLPGGEFADILSTNILVTEIFNPLAGDRLLTALNVVIFITDGFKKVDDTITNLLATTYQQLRIAGFSVGIKPGCDESLARGTSVNPRKINETYFMVDYQSLPKIVDNVVDKICSYKMGLIPL